MAINKIHGIVCIVNGSDDDTARKTKKPTTEAKDNGYTYGGITAYRFEEIDEEAEKE